MKRQIDEELEPGLLDSFRSHRVDEFIYFIVISGKLGSGILDLLKREK